MINIKLINNRIIFTPICLPNAQAKLRALMNFAR